MADALRSGRSESILMRVQVPPSAQIRLAVWRVFLFKLQDFLSQAFAKTVAAAIRFAAKLSDKLVQWPYLQGVKVAEDGEFGWYNKSKSGMSFIS